MLSKELARMGSGRLEEGKAILLITLRGIFGSDPLTQVVVCIVADGRKKIHPRVLDCLTLLGVYQAGDHMKNMINGEEVCCFR